MRLLGWTYNRAGELVGLWAMGFVLFSIFRYMHISCLLFPVIMNLHHSMSCAGVLVFLFLFSPTAL